MAYRRYRRKSNASSIISDVAYIASKVSWQGALLLGLFSFILFSFVLPAWLVSILQEQKDNLFYPMLETIFARRLHWFGWLGIATGLIGLYFAIRNYHYTNNVHWQERSIVSFLAKLLGRSID